MTFCLSFNCAVMHLNLSLQNICNPNPDKHSIVQSNSVIKKLLGSDKIYFYIYLVYTTRVLHDRMKYLFFWAIMSAFTEFVIDDFHISKIQTIKLND